MEQLTVALAERSYPISIGSGLYHKSDSYWPLCPGESVVIVTNETLAPLYLPVVKQTLLLRGIVVDTVVVPDGEQYKTLQTLEMIFNALLEKPHSRDTTVIALGGGVVGDMAGFAAACYQRGVRFIQMPTTLLSQVDSSVGGKTAVNHPLGKNMIGAFYQPAAVIIDTDCLVTLPQRELASGLAEVIKYGVILDELFFDWLEQHIDSLLALDQLTVARCISRCCQLKAQVVALDERESGPRALLNLGHTFGHAIEAHMGYGNWMHGEAVAAGMMMAARTAELLGDFSQQDSLRLMNLLQRAGLPVNGPASMQAEEYLPHMLRDKKVLAGTLRLVLPEKIGKARVISGVTDDIVLSAIRSCHSV